MIALTSATGKLGSAVLNAILDNKLVNPKDLVICTSSNPTSAKLAHLHAQNITIRHADFDNLSSLERAYAGCTKLFLVSTPRIEMDYDDAPLWQGREKHHRAAIDAAVKVGIKHVYYTSLAFGNPSKANVMRAHVRTESYLKELERENKVRVTVLREGLYNESWPLYFGYYYGLKDEVRKEVVVAGDGRVSWTAIADMGFGTARILAASEEEWEGRMVYLSQKQTWMLQDIARMVSKIKGEEISLKIVSRKGYEEYYVNCMKKEKAAVEWWSSTYDALKDGECAIEDATLEKLLKEDGRAPKSLEDSIREMLS